MDLEKHLKEGLPDIHMEPQDNDDEMEVLVLDIQHFPWEVVSYQLGSGQD